MLQGNKLLEKFMKIYLIILILSSFKIYAMDKINDLWHVFLNSHNKIQDIIKEENPLDCEPSLASAQQEELWQKIIACAYEKLPPLRQEKFIEQLFNSTVFNNMGTKADEIKHRERLIFRYGSVAKVRLVPQKNQSYTGLFRTGAVGLIRMSLVGDPSIWGSFLPAFELKLFVDDVCSLNMLATDEITCQDADHNFLTRILSNQIPTPETSLAKFVTLILALTKNLPDPRSSIAFAKIENCSQIVLKHNAPRQLYFVPLEQKLESKDFREDLALLSPNTTLYQVMAADQRCIRAEHIADLVLESKFVASSFGDHQLFFNF